MLKSKYETCRCLKSKSGFPMDFVISAPRYIFNKDEHYRYSIHTINTHDCTGYRSAKYNLYEIRTMGDKFITNLFVHDFQKYFISINEDRENKLKDILNG